jgi:hypothetical protein
LKSSKKGGAVDRDTRNAIERATQRARKLLEEDFAAQLRPRVDSTAVHIREGASQSI